MAAPAPPAVGPHDVKAMLADGRELALLDLREELIFSRGHLLHARSLPERRDRAWKMAAVNLVGCVLFGVSAIASTWCRRPGRFSPSRRRTGPLPSAPCASSSAR